MFMVFKINDFNFLHENFLSIFLILIFHFIFNKCKITIFLSILIILNLHFINDKS